MSYPAYKASIKFTEIIQNALEIPVVFNKYITYTRNLRMSVQG